MPKTRVTYWQQKFEANQDRDRVSVSALEEMGWKVMVIWECEALAKDSGDLRKRLIHFLNEK